MDDKRCLSRVSSVFSNGCVFGYRVKGHWVKDWNQGQDWEASLIREVISITVKNEGPFVEIWVTATSFCHQMVRSIVGTLVAIGKGRLNKSDVSSIIAKKDRNSAGPVAPPQGLTLMEVSY